MKTMTTRALIALISFSVALLSACGTRSISNSGYEADSSRGYRSQRVVELSEFEVLGIDPKAGATEADIKAALDARKAISVKKGSGVMLVQSGTAIPDEAMRKALERVYNVTGFTGVPVETPYVSPIVIAAGKGPPTPPPTAYASALRLAAARASCDNIIVYWGVLETASENKATKNISWVPFLGWGINDENQIMRIRLKVAVIDTQSGQWSMFSPEAIDDTASSSFMSRKASDQRQVELLKDKAYVATADDIIKRFAR